MQQSTTIDGCNVSSNRSNIPIAEALIDMPFKRHQDVHTHATAIVGLGNGSALFLR
jgi:hypothetical protein